MNSALRCGLSLCFSLFALASSASAADMAWGVHGMVLFDAEGELASHMPLYQAPHHYQVVLALRWTAAERERLQQLLATDTLVTLVPKAFDLERLAPHSDKPLHELNVDIYAGHFERGGVLRWADVAVGIAQVIYFAPLSLAPGTAAKQRCFQPISWHGQSYLLEQIQSRPGEDLIVQLDAALPGTTERFCVESAGWSSASQHINFPGQISATRRYRETDDLQ